MSAEKYVNLILKNVKCSKKKGTEIKEQLLSDIYMRMDKGEEWDSIMQSMGTPEEISDEFNQNLSEDEKKAYKKRKTVKIIVFITAAILIVLLALVSYIRWTLPKTSVLGSSGIFSQGIVEEKTKNVILLLNQNDFDALQADSTDVMQPLLTLENIGHARALTSDDWGQMESIGTIYSCEFRQRGQIFATVQVSVSYENVNVIYTITFDKEMKLAGLYMR